MDRIWIGSRKLLIRSKWNAIRCIRSVGSNNCFTPYRGICFYRENAIAIEIEAKRIEQSGQAGICA